MSTDDRSEENRTMDEAQSARKADAIHENDAKTTEEEMTAPMTMTGRTQTGSMAEHTPTAEAAPSAGSATTDETLRLDEAVSPTSPTIGPAAPTAAPITEPTPEPSYAGPASPTAYRRGPAVATILLGLLCLAVAGFAFADQTLDFTVDWARVGPLGVLFGGAVLVLLGVLGMRRRRDS